MMMTTWNCISSALHNTKMPDYYWINVILSLRKILQQQLVSANQPTNLDRENHFIEKINIIAPTAQTRRAQASWHPFQVHPKSSLRKHTIFVGLLYLSMNQATIFVLQAFWKVAKYEPNDHLMQ